MKRVQRAGDGDITGGGTIVPSLQKTPLNYTLKRSRSPRAAFSIQKMETSQHEFASSSHNYRAFASFSKCWQVKLLFQFSSRFLTWVPFSDLSHPPCFCLTWDWFSQVSLAPVLIFITGHVTIFFQFRKFFQSSVFQAHTISPPHFTSQSPPSWSTELCTWTSRQAWLMRSGRVEAGRPKAEGLFSVKILGFLQTDRAPESIPGPLLQFLPLHSTTKPPHRYCSALGNSLGSKSNSKAETGAQATRLVFRLCLCTQNIWCATQPSSLIQKGFYGTCWKWEIRDFIISVILVRRPRKLAFQLPTSLSRRKESNRNHLGVPADVNICGVLRPPGPLPFTQIGRLQI